MDLSQDYEVRFELDKLYHVIVVNGIYETTNSGKDFISHILMGEAGQKFKRNFYIHTEKSRQYYTSFLSSCGIKRKETADWKPENLNGKMVNVSFFIETYDTYDDDGNPIQRESFKMKRFGVFTGDDGAKTGLEMIFEEIGKGEDGCPF